MGFAWGDGDGIPPEDREEYERRQRERPSKQSNLSDDGIRPETQSLSPEEIDRRWDYVTQQLASTGEVGSIFN